MQVVGHYFRDCWILMYIERWLKVAIRLPDGRVLERDKGTPEDGVISLMLAIMFLHVVFDAWMERHYGNTRYGTIRWERYVLYI